MRNRVTHILIALLMLTVTGCGLFRSTTKIESSSDSTAVKNETIALSEYELLQADIPASYIKTITTPSGMKIELRDSIEERGQGIDDGRDESHSINKSNQQDSMESISEPPNLGFISIDFERDKKQQDSTITKTQKEKRHSKVQETEIETNGSWITWILVGIAIALALALAGMIFLN